jgi:hypothetical protein
VRPLVVLGVLTLGLAACGGSPAPKEGRPAKITFGVQGGSIAPWTVVIEKDGTVKGSGSRQAAVTGKLSTASRTRVSRLVQQAFAGGLSSRHCPNTLPDVASPFIAAEGRRVSVHGTCEPRFEILFETLSRAVGLGRA